MAQIEDDPAKWVGGPARMLLQSLTNRGDVSRFKAMPHLGAVSWVDPGVRHSRWDYIVRTMSLAQRTAATDQVYGRFGKVRLGGFEVGAGRDLLYCWAMLGSLGHLWGTFAAERLVLDALRQSEHTRALFVDVLPDEDRDFARRVIEKYLIYDLHHVITVGFLSTSTDLGTTAERELLLEILRAQRNPRRYDYKVVQLAAAFQEIRRLAYLSLDLKYAHLPIRMNPEALHDKIGEHVSELLGRSAGALDSMLMHLNAYMRPEIYLAPEVIQRHGLLQGERREAVAASLDGAESPNGLFEILNRMREKAAWDDASAVAHPDGQRLHWHLHRVIEPRGPKRTRDDFFAEIPARAAELEQRVRGRCMTHVVVGADSQEMFYDIFVPMKSDSSDLGIALIALCQTMERGDPDDSGTASRHLYRWGKEIGDLARRLIAARLRDSQRLFIPGSDEIGAHESCLLIDPGGAGQLIARLESVVRDVEAREGRLEPQSEDWTLARARKHEVEVLMSSMEGHGAWNYRIVMSSGFHVVWPTVDLHGAAQFDGAYIDIRPSKVRLWLVEAKRRFSELQAVEESSAQLSDRLHKLGWTAERPPAAVGRGAEVPIILAL